MAKILEVEDLHKDFTMFILGGKKIHALEGISFEMEEGEIVGLTGKSGSGKSTLMKCVHRTYLPTSGNILVRKVNGGVLDLATAPEHDVLALRRSEMTYCSQFLHAIPAAQLCSQHDPLLHPHRSRLRRILQQAA